MRFILNKSLVRFCVIIAVAAFLNGCDSDPPSGDFDFDHSSAILAAPTCGETSTADASGHDLELAECLHWSYENSLLSLTHVAAVYNCCLDSIKIDMVVGEQTISIVESEHPEGGQGCRCVCQYTLEYQVSVGSAGSYLLRLRSHTQYEGVQELFEISLNLAATPSGTYCLED